MIKITNDIKLQYAGFMLVIPISLYFLYLSDSLNKVILFLTIYVFFRFLIEHILSEYIQDYIPDNLRSATVSLVSSLSSVILVIIQTLMSWVLDFYSNKYFLNGV